MSDLTRQQLCVALSISESTVRRLEQDGLPFTPVGARAHRYDLTECKRWLKAKAAPVEETAEWRQFLGIVSTSIPGVPEPVEQLPPMERAALIRYHANKRRAAKLKRTPVWADLTKIAAIYAEADKRSRESGQSFHVDHVIPMQGKYVSGLHVENNLQILLASDNNRKYNHFEVGS